MFDSYTDIFEKRGKSYHNAMLDCPKARDEEFFHLFDHIEIKESDVVADIPSGGCYLKNYVNNDNIYFVDSTKEFLNNCTCKYNIIHSDVEDTPFKHSFFDIVFSLAGTHHIDNKEKLYKEIYRILNNNGKFIYADVKRGSKEDAFLNTFVNENNSLGHRGVFIDKNTNIELENINLEVQYSEYIEYTWNFKDIREMVYYVKNLFGIDLASDEIILEGLRDILGFKEENGLIKLNWGLLYIVSKKII